jgi:hypothetical protein
MICRSSSAKRARAKVHLAAAERMPRHLTPVYAGAGPNVCYNALSSAKQKSATAHCYRAFQRNPYKGGVTSPASWVCAHRAFFSGVFRLREKAFRH